MTYTQSRIFQWIGILLALGIIATGYYYFRAAAGVKIDTLSPTGSLTSGLVGYWPFDTANVSGTTAYDRSTNKFHGTMSGGPSIVAGTVHEAVDLDGTNDFVSMGDQSSLDVGDTADFSISGWFSRDTFTTDDVIVAKVNSTGSGEIGYVLYIDDATDQLILKVGDGIDTYFIASSTTFTSATWTHFAVVWDQDSASGTMMYINGSAAASGASGTIGNINDLSNALAFRVGQTQAGSDFFDGKLDEIRFYNRVLTASEAATLYSYTGKGEILNSSASQPQGVGRLDSGLAGYWKLDDGSGTTATDSSVRGNNGTLNSGPTWTTGQIEGALNFDGADDNVTTAKTMANSGTVSVWVNTTATINSSASYYALYATTSGNSFFLSFNGFGGENRWDFSYRGNFGTTVRIVGPTLTSSAQVQGWHLLTATWDVSSGAVLYVDGQRVSSTSTTTSSFASMSFGLSTNSLARWLGKLDEVRMYDRILDASEVSALYRLTSPSGTDTSLKGYWSFNGRDVSGTTAYDRSGAGNNGTLTNGPAVTPGKVGQALQFDGTDDYVSISNNASLTLGTAVTFSIWIKPATTSVPQLIFRKWSSGAEDKYISLNSSGAISFYLYNVFGGSQLSTAASAVTANAWTHVVGRYDGSTAKIYINGIEAASKSASGDVADNGVSALNIGRDPDGADSYFNGILDEFRIYHSALSAAEIQSLYQQGQSDETNTSASQPQGVGRLDSGLAGYWKLDDGSGTSAADSSTNGNTGTLTNGPTWTAGQIGGAVDFDGVDDYISAGSPTVLDDLTTYTVSAWIKPDTVGASGVAKAVTKSGTGFSSGWAFNVCSNEATLCSGTANTLNFSVAFGTAGRWRTPADSITLGQWNFIAVSYNRSSLSNNPEIYINGVSHTVTETSSPASAYVSDASANLIIGNNSDGTHDFDGSIDEVRIYNRALSADEVSQLYRLTSPTGVDTSLKGYWSFNGKDVSGTTAYDRSGAGNNGTLTNGPTVTPGKLGQALSLDGTNDYVRVKDGAILSGSTNATISAWIKTSISAVSGGKAIYAERASSGNDIFKLAALESGVADNTATFILRDDAGTLNRKTGSIVINDNNWHHIVAVKNGTSLLLYVDGVADGSPGTQTGTNTYTNANLKSDIGQDASAQPGNFNGAIDEVRIYNRALTASEITALYQASK